MPDEVSVPKLNALSGTNTFRMNEALIVKALQHFFETVLFDPQYAPHVRSVVPVSQNGLTVYDVVLDSPK